MAKDCKVSLLNQISQPNKKLFIFVLATKIDNKLKLTFMNVRGSTVYIMDTENEVCSGQQILEGDNSRIPFLETMCDCLDYRLSPLPWFKI